MQRLRIVRMMAFLAASGVTVAIGGCGGAGNSTASNNTASLPALEDSRSATANVVQVAGAGNVNEAALAHWIAVQAATDYKSRPTQPVPQGVAPDPPLYRRCIAHLRAEPMGPNPQNPNKPKPKPTDANLKKECESEYELLRQHVLLLLTSFQWLAGESAREGIKISDATVRQKLERLRKEQFPTTLAFQQYMRNTGQTYEDQLLRVRIELYATELVRVAGERAHATSRQGAFEAYLKTAGAIARRWAAKTTCSPGYVTQNCANYKGTLEPEIRI